jgi:hypothetical protein
MVRVLLNIEPDESARAIRSTLPPKPFGVESGSPSITICRCAVRVVVLMRIPAKRQNVPMKKSTRTGKLPTPRQAARELSERRVLYPPAARRGSSSLKEEGDSFTVSSNSSGERSAAFPVNILRFLRYRTVSWSRQSTLFSGIKARITARKKLLAVNAIRVIKVSSVKKAIPIYRRKKNPITRGETARDDPVFKIAVNRRFICLPPLPVP